MSLVVFQWTLRDVLAGKRGIGLLVAALVPTLLLALIVGTGGSVAANERATVTAVLTTTVLLPFIVGLIAIVAGGAVLRRPLEEGTMLYQLIRPTRRFVLGTTRSVAAALAVAVLSIWGGLALGFALGEWDLVVDALPGLAVGGLAFGALYGLIVSLHRYALGLAVLHLVAEAALARLSFRVHELTLSWHLWGSMGSLADLAANEGVIPSVGGSLAVPVVVALGAAALTGVLFQVRAFGLGIGEQ